MNQAQKKEVAATLLRAGRRDLAQKFIGARAVDLGSDLKAMRESWNRHNNGATFHFKWKNNPFELALIEKEEIVVKDGVTGPERKLYISTYPTGIKKKSPPKDVIKLAVDYVRKRSPSSAIGSTARIKRNVKACVTGRRDQRVTAAKKHKDVEYEVGRKIFKTLDEAAAHAVLQGMSGSSGTVNIDVLVHSEAGAAALMGDDGVESYQEDPDASVFMRIAVKVNMVGRIA